ncbi:efflux RND transporter periplasmic adaptor subunit [Cellulomonas sp. URHB0016]
MRKNMLRLWRRTGPLLRIVAGVAVLGVATALVWWFGVRDASASDAAGPTTRTVAASLTTLQKSVSASGTIAPAVRQDVSFTVSGTVTAVPVATGQTVAAGQTLATVDTLQLQADLLEARATLAKAQATLSDATDGSDGSTSAKAQIAAARAQVDVAESKVDAAQSAMTGSTLTAPVAGLLIEVNLEVGDAVTGSGGGNEPDQSDGDSDTSGQFVIVGTDAWQVEVDVSDADVASLQVGDQAEVTPDGATDPVFGTIATIGLLSTSTEGVAAYPVTVALTPGQEGLHDGVAADVELVYQRRTDVLTVPSLAVTTTDGTSTVTKVAADGTQSTAEVTVGETSGNLTEITAGLAEGDEVVLAVFTPGGNRSGQTGDDGPPQLQGGYGPQGGFQGGPPQGSTQSFQGGPNDG